MAKIEWKEVVKIQYDAMQRSSALFVAILAALIAFAKQLSLGNLPKLAIIVALTSVLAQNLAVLYLTNIQRQASWKIKIGEDPTEKNELENRYRKWVLILATIASVSIIAVLFLIFSDPNQAGTQCLNNRPRR